MRSANDGRVAVRGQRDRVALKYAYAANEVGAGADQLRPLLRPSPTAAREHPRRAHGSEVVERAANDDGVAGGSERRRLTQPALPRLIGREQDLPLRRYSVPRGRRP